MHEFAILVVNVVLCACVCGVASNKMMLKYYADEQETRES